MRKITYEQAAMEAIQEEFRRDDKTVHLATDMNEPLLKEFGENRVRSTPISEAAFAGAAIGLAGSGFRPIVRIRMATFGFVAMDQLMNQAAKITYMFGGQTKFPILYRMTVGTGMSMAAQHSINPYPMYMNIPGLKIILPSTPCDVKGLLKTAIRDNNPVVSFEHMGLGDSVGEVPEEEYLLPLGKALTRKEGSDVTIVALAKMVHLSLEVAEEFENRGISVEVIDPRTLMPLDRESIKASVIKTGRLIVVDEACRTCGTAGEIIASVVEDKEVFNNLKSAPERVTGLDVPVPFAIPMEKYVVPDREKISAAVRRIMGDDC